MIVPMQKYAFMVYHKEYDNFLHTLRDLGVVHVKQTKPIAGCAELQKMLTDRKRVQALLKDLKRLNDESKDAVLLPAGDLSKAEGLRLVEKIEILQEKKAQLLVEKQLLLKDMTYMELWGDFSYTTINNLKEAGYVVTFFNCPTARFEPAWVNEYNAFLVNNVQSVSYFVTVTKEDEPVDIEAERSKMPDRGLEALHTAYQQLQDNIKHTDDNLKELAASEYNTLEAFDRSLQDDFNYANVQVQTEQQADHRLMFLEGWTTKDQTQNLETELDKQGYFFRQLETEENDPVPIKLKNNSYSRLFEPITRMFSLPNYTELDPTPLLAPFFMLFFGLCFGDGGYGLLVLLACTFLKKKVSPDMRPILSLFQYLGGTTIIIGILTGTFFGVALVDVPAFKAVKDYFLSSDNLMKIAIIVGLVHIVFGKCVAAYKTKVQKGVKYSIAPWAWVFIIVSLLLVFGLPVLDIQLPQTMVYACYGVAIAGALLAFLYNSPGKNVFLNFGSGLWITYNTASGMLGDTLSYIRLYAIGLTGGILGGVFNMLGVDMTAGLPLVARIPIMLIILLVGHGLNIGLCTISSLVHPVRLIFVEYYKNSEFEGGGKEYSPFKKA
ncbi:MAG: ATPase [Tannerellaceae bacterium]|jgi:V/A-type H+-transporting ATPase subunit I|nr:ATPase [Tannerellaceae bacterium]